MVELTPEVKAQLESQKAQCIFCKILSGEYQSQKVFSDKVVSAVLDIRPATEGHTVVMPNEHYPIMPYIPHEEFRHLFGGLPKIAGGICRGVMKSAIAAFIANGAAAGQQSPHFLIHLIPRANGDNLGLFDFDKEKPLERDKNEQAYRLLAQNLPIMLKNHFAKHPASWHKETGSRPDFLPKGTAIYEDEKVLVMPSETPQQFGHLIAYPKTKKHFTELSKETAAHLFFVASFAATAVFEGLGAHGTNIIAKSGVTFDHPSGITCIHILPRYQEDGLDILWKGKEGENLEGAANKVKSGLSGVDLDEEEGSKEKEEQKEVKREEQTQEQTQNQSQRKQTHELNQQHKSMQEVQTKTKVFASAQEEIAAAIKSIQENK